MLLAFPQSLATNAKVPQNTLSIKTAAWWDGKALTPLNSLSPYILPTAVEGRT
jgi:hypothetical protein